VESTTVELRARTKSGTVCSGAQTLKTPLVDFPPCIGDIIHTGVYLYVLIYV
jgi:hypothetical protein